jgi:hypothetical protein
MENCAPIDLMGWTPPENWADDILSRNIADAGEAQTIEAFEIPTNSDGADIAARVEDFIRQCRGEHAFEVPKGLPASVVILACLKHSSPLPPEFWRRSVFPVERAN